MGASIGDATEKVIPICRYHSDVRLEKQHANAANQFMALVAGNMNGTAFGSQVIVRTVGYAFSIYKCPKCSYLEFHDDSPLPPNMSPLPQVQSAEEGK